MSISLSVCLCVSDSHEKGVGVSVCISALQRERGFLQHDSGSAGPRSCLSHVPSVAMATEDCKTDTHTCTHIHTGKTYSLSVSLTPHPRHTHTHTHTHSCSSPAAPRCNRNTEEPAWAEERHYTTLVEYRRCQKRKESGGRRVQQRRERERERVQAPGRQNSASPAEADIHREELKHLQADRHRLLVRWGMCLITLTSY